MKRGLIAAIGVVALLAGATACGSDDKTDSSSKKTGPESYKGQTLTVWAMDGSTPPG
ncbi:sugar transporter, partial [Streptomyces sp. NPDC004658]